MARQAHQDRLEAEWCLPRTTPPVESPQLRALIERCRAGYLLARRNLICSEETARLAMIRLQRSAALLRALDAHIAHLRRAEAERAPARAPVGRYLPQPGRQR